MEKLPEDLSGCKALLCGYGRSNRALMRLLVKEGARVSIFDSKKSRDVILREAQEDGCKDAQVINNESEISADIVFRAPGIRPDRGIILNAVKNGAYLSSEVELFFERAKGKIYGITGSDGKTTTSTITARILEKAFKNTNKKVFVGGNIGTPLVSFLDKLTESDVTVAELSSFQLMTLKRSPCVSAITNLSENHLDYHTDIQEYIRAKTRIFSEIGCERLIADERVLSVVKGREDIASRLPKEVTLLGENGDICVKNGYITLGGKRVMDVKQIRVPGLHNVKNYMTAIGITKNDASFSDVFAVAESFCGVKHRMELVAERNGIKFYNSSIDSTPSRSIVTLRCFEKPLTVICGGYDKHLDYSELAGELLLRADNVVITGASREIIKRELDRQNFSSRCNVYCEKDFENAVIKAAMVTKNEGTVLLSPACASFDAFNNFEERGELFCKIVKSL